MGRPIPLDFPAFGPGLTLSLITVWVCSGPSLFSRLPTKYPFQFVCSILKYYMSLPGNLTFLWRHTFTPDFFFFFKCVLIGLVDHRLPNLLVASPNTGMWGTLSLSQTAGGIRQENTVGRMQFSDASWSKRMSFDRKRKPEYLKETRAKRSTEMEMG